MASRVIFSIYIDIPKNKLDNPAGFHWKTGEQETTVKSLEVKKQFLKYKDKLKQKQEEYAAVIGADYILHEYDSEYELFCEMFRREYPQISEYDIINFYKQWLMKVHAESYKCVCYLDFDVIPNTTEDIFLAHDPQKFACAEQNKDALWGKTCLPEQYRKGIRDPASKYWNTHAMLMEEGYKPDTDVFNTAIMVATKEQIKKLDYFGNFKKVLDLMTDLKYDKFSMYPYQIQRVFNYDNETVFAYKRIVNDVDIDYINELWHSRLSIDTPIINPEAKMYHVIHKRFEKLL